MDRKRVVGSLYVSGGMADKTLRDEIALEVLKAYLLRDESNFNKAAMGSAEVAYSAYQIADAMIRARGT